MTSMSPERREKYLQAQDISDAPQWAVDAAARRKELTADEKVACVARLRSEHGWTYIRIAKLFGVSSEVPRQWFVMGTEEGRARNRDMREARIEKDPYREARYMREYRGRKNHGTTTWLTRIEMWRRQGGLCYLCGDPLGPDRLGVIDHDHRCCPLGYSCRVCRRGLACNMCNLIIGNVQDDPDRLERIAVNLRTAVNSVTERMKSTEAP